ncbi:MAG: hypothetical protein K6F56_01515 [Oscillospiraceae bacterium]|nr:hypothetical protein [Oscillospiraceae bacterium]
MKKKLRRCLLTAFCLLLCVFGNPAYAENPESGAPPSASEPLTLEERAALEKSLMDSLRVVNNIYSQKAKLENRTDYHLRDVYFLGMTNTGFIYEYELPAHTAVYYNINSNVAKICDGDDCYIVYTIGDYTYTSGNYQLRVVEESEEEGLEQKIPPIQIETDEGLAPLSPGQTVELDGKLGKTLKKSTVLSVKAPSPNSISTYYDILLSYNLLVKGKNKENWSSLTLKVVDEEGFIVENSHIYFGDDGEYECYLALPTDRGTLTLRFDE